MFFDNKKLLSQCIENYIVCSNQIFTKEYKETYVVSHSEKPAETAF